jgi:chemotaxis signal transduction protein
LVDRVEDVAEADVGQAAPPPGLSADWARIAAGQAAAGDELFLLADIAALIGGPNSGSALNPALTLSD